VPSAISIMDMSFHFFPQLFRKKDLYQLTYWTEYSVRKAKRIFTISQASKRDIIKIYKIPEEKVLVTYPGIKPFISLTPRVYTESMLSSQFDIRSPYFLFVGTLQPRKNIVSLIDAFSQIVKSNLSDDLSLIIIGKKGWLFEEILQAPEKYGVSSRVHFLHNVSDDQLPIFYKHAIALVLPSLYEGFGLPVLEAMQNECPVITSNVSSLPEAGGDACLYVDPKDTSDIVKKMMQLLKEKDLRQKLIEKGKRQVKKFSWDKTARQTLEALEDLVRKKD
jgi:glycosyltransferase involved in cell wall biosynthesis